MSPELLILLVIMSPVIGFVVSWVFLSLVIK